MECKNPVYNRVDLTKEKVSTLKYGFYLSIIKTGGNTDGIFWERVGGKGKIRSGANKVVNWD